MAAPVVIANLGEIPSAIFINVHSLQESASIVTIIPRLTTWRDLYFPILAGAAAVDPKVNRGLIWVVPTNEFINDAAPNLSTWAIGYMDPVINLVQNQIWSIAFITASFTAAQLTAIKDAFNTAWT